MNRCNKSKDEDIFVRFRYHPEMTEDVLNYLRFFGSEIFEKRLSKILLYFTLFICTIVFIIKIIYFALYPSKHLLILYGPIFLQIFWGGLNLITLIFINKNMLKKVLSSIKLWSIDSAGNETKLIIMNEAKRMKILVIFSLTVCYLCVFTSCFIEDYKKWHILGFLFKLVLYFSPFILFSNGYQLIYGTTQIRFQMYIFSNLIEDITLGFDNDNLNLMYDQNYQKEIEFRLKVLIKRHCDFLIWRTEATKSMNYLILPFSLGGCLILFSIVLYIFQFTAGLPVSKILLLFRLLLAILASNSLLWAIIKAGQNLEEESEKMFNALMTSDWYNWNESNKKLFIIFLCNTKKPMTLNYRNYITINYKLALALFRAAYSFISFFYQTQ